MKFLKPILIALVVIIVFILTGIEYYIQGKGKIALEQRLKTELNRNISIQGLHFQFPFGVTAQDVLIEGILSAEKINAQLNPQSLSAFFQSRSAVNKSNLMIEKLDVKSGEIVYFAKNQQGSGAFTIKDVLLTAYHIPIPISPVVTDFNVIGHLEQNNSPFTGSLIKGEGWIDFGGKNMDASFELVKEGGDVGLTARTIAKNNDLKVTGSIEAAHLLPFGTDPLLMGNTVFANTLEAVNLSVDAQYEFETKLDAFQLTNVTFNGNVSTRSSK